MENWRKFQTEITKDTTIDTIPAPMRTGDDIARADTMPGESSSEDSPRLKLLKQLQGLLDVKKAAVQKTVGGEFVFYDDVLDPDGKEIPTAKKFFPDDESIKIAIEKVSSGSLVAKEDNLEEKRKKKKKKKKQDACYHKVKRRYKVWPSAYASGALVRCRKVGAKNWGNKSKKK
tara:strand:+ start:36 stop:557 length:522 start_codon:yes stop_codon:yes gene_type:complete